jgi:purine-cytosine permease-like protein
MRGVYRTPSERVEAAQRARRLRTAAISRLFVDNGVWGLVRPRPASLRTASRVGSDEFPNSPAPSDRSFPWWKIAITNVLFSICLLTLITGVDLGIAALRRYFVSGIVVGCLILTVIGILTSVLGSRTRLSSYMLARIAFGTQGSTLLNLAFAVSLLGWFGTNINLFGDALARKPEIAAIAAARMVFILSLVPLDWRCGESPLECVKAVTMFHRLTFFADS